MSCQEFNSSSNSVGLISMSRRMLRNVRPGSIVLAHDGQNHLDNRLEQLPNFLAGLRRNCYAQTTVGDLLRQTGFYGVRTGGSAPGTNPSPGAE